MKYIGLFSRVGYAMGDASNNDLLIKNRYDLMHFRNTTHARIVIMGRKTVESLPKKLDDRFVICLSRDECYKTDKADAVLMSVDDVVFLCEKLKETWGIKEAYVCGGAEILSLFSNKIDEMIVTEFHAPMSDFSHVKEFILIPTNIRSYLALWNKVFVKRDHEFDIVHYFRLLE